VSLLGSFELTLRGLGKGVTEKVTGGRSSKPLSDGLMSEKQSTSFALSCQGKEIWSNTKNMPAHKKRNKYLGSKTVSYKGKGRGKNAKPQGGGNFV